MGFWNKIFGTKTPDGYTKVRIQEFIDANMAGGVIPIDLFIELQNKLLSGEQYAVLPNDVILSIEKDKKAEQDKVEAMNKCAALNNLGIKYEREGNIALAISTYEENLSSPFIACHSFDRLMILYRKQKDYDNEIRVIQKALEGICERYPQLKEKYLKRLEKAKALKLK